MSKNDNHVVARDGAVLSGAKARTAVRRVTTASAGAIDARGTARRDRVARRARVGRPHP
jgi:hypothetical protein